MVFQLLRPAARSLARAPRALPLQMRAVKPLSTSALRLLPSPTGPVKKDPTDNKGYEEHRVEVEPRQAAIDENFTFEEPQVGPVLRRDGEDD